MMGQYTKIELEVALCDILSVTNKCKKALEKQTLGQSQQTLLRNRIKAFEISSDLIKKALAETKS